MNLKVVSTTITFNAPATQVTLTPVTIDGIEVDQEYGNPIQSIAVSQVFKYQGKSEIDLECQETQKRLHKIMEWIE